ncbi:MAG TPA: hypothetical protein VMH87_08580, partial [Pseudomonadales bacterium]|nr:hypothetical protein [Pseudomonadales bacterium]
MKGFLPIAPHPGPPHELFKQGLADSAVKKLALTPALTRSRPLARSHATFVPLCGTNSFRRFPSGSSLP